MIVRLQPRGFTRVEGSLASSPLDGPIEGQFARPDPTEIAFQLGAADVRYLMDQPATGVGPKLRLACTFIRDEDAPDDTKWGYRLQIAQPHGPVGGQFSDGVALTLDSDGFHRSEHSAFTADEATACHRIVMEMRSEGGL